MHRKRVLLMMDFSRWSYAAHRAVLEMHASERLHVMLLVMGPNAQSGQFASAQRFTQLMAETHVSRGATAEVVVAADDAISAVRHELSRVQFDLVVAGENLASCRGRDDSAEWLLVDNTGLVSRRLFSSGTPRSQKPSWEYLRGGVARGMPGRSRTRIAELVCAASTF